MRPAIAIVLLMTGCSAAASSPECAHYWTRMRNYVHRWNSDRLELDQKVFETEMIARDWCDRHQCCLHEEPPPVRERRMQASRSDP